MDNSISSQGYLSKLSRSIAFLLLVVLMGVGNTEIAIAQGKKKAQLHIVFLISEDPDNYAAHLTIPEFADNLAKSKKYKTTVLKGESNRTAYRFPNFELLKEADLVVVFARRLALASDQIAELKSYLKRGGGLVGIRTANHAFKLMKGERAAEGHEEWPEFVSDVLGCENRGYALATSNTEVQMNVKESKSSLLKGIESSRWLSDGNLYWVDPLLTNDAQVLLFGKADQKTEPIAWTRHYGQSRIFYTSLGYPTDFKNVKFIKLLEHAIAWAMNKNT